MEAKTTRRSLEVFIVGRWGDQDEEKGERLWWFRKKEIPRTSIRAISAGHSHLAMLDGTGALYMLGSNSEGQCGFLPEAEAFLPYPKTLPGIRKVAKVSCGGSFTAILTQAGSVYVCGRFPSGSASTPVVQGSQDHGRFIRWELPRPNYVKQNEEGEEAPRPNKAHSRFLQFLDIAAGDEHIIAVSEYGNLHVCGEGGQGQLGNGDINTLSTPTRLNVVSENTPGLPSVLFRSVFAGGNSSYAISSKGKAFSWGDNPNGILGHGHSDSVYVPTRIKALKDCQVAEVVCSQRHTVFLDTNGKVYTCGRSMYGCLGLPSDILRITNIDHLRGKVPVRTVAPAEVKGEEEGTEESVEKLMQPSGRIQASFVAASGNDWSEEVYANSDSWRHVEFQRSSTENLHRLRGLAGDVTVLEPRPVRLPPTVHRSRPTCVVAGGSFSGTVMDDGRFFWWGRGSVWNSILPGMPMVPLPVPSAFPVPKEYSMATTYSHLVFSLLNLAPPQLADLLLETPFTTLGEMWAKLHTIIVRIPHRELESLNVSGNHYPLVRLLMRDMAGRSCWSELLEPQHRKYALPAAFVLYQAVAVALEVKARAVGIAESLASVLPLRRKRGAPPARSFPPPEAAKDTQAEVLQWVQVHGLLDLPLHQESLPNVPSPLMEQMTVAFWHSKKRTQELSGSAPLTLGTTAVPVAATAFARRSSMEEDVKLDPLQHALQVQEHSSIESDSSSSEDSTDSEDERDEEGGSMEEMDTHEPDEEGSIFAYKLVDAHVRHAVSCLEGNFLCLVVDTVEERQVKKDPSPVNLHTRDLTLQNATFWYKLGMEHSKQVLNHSKAPSLMGVIRARRMSRLSRRVSLSEYQRGRTNKGHTEEDSSIKLILRPKEGDHSHNSEESGSEDSGPPVLATTAGDQLAAALRILSDAHVQGPAPPQPRKPQQKTQLQPTARVVSLLQRRGLSVEEAAPKEAKAAAAPTEKDTIPSRTKVYSRMMKDMSDKYNKTLFTSLKPAREGSGSQTDSSEEEATAVDSRFQHRYHVPFLIPKLPTQVSAAKRRHREEQSRASAAQRLPARFRHTYLKSRGHTGRRRGTAGTEDRDTDDGVDEWQFHAHESDFWSYSEVVSAWNEEVKEEGDDAASLQKSTLLLTDEEWMTQYEELEKKLGDSGTGTPLYRPQTVQTTSARQKPQSPRFPGVSSILDDPVQALSQDSVMSMLPGVLQGLSSRGSSRCTSRAQSPRHAPGSAPLHCRTRGPRRRQRQRQQPQAEEVGPLLTQYLQTPLVSQWSKNTPSPVPISRGKTQTRGQPRGTAATPVNMHPGSYGRTWGSPRLVRAHRPTLPGAGTSPRAACSTAAAKPDFEPVMVTAARIPRPPPSRPGQAPKRRLQRPLSIPVRGRGRAYGTDGAHYAAGEAVEADARAGGVGGMAGEQPVKLVTVHSPWGGNKEFGFPEVTNSVQSSTPDSHAETIPQQVPRPTWNEGVY